MSTENSQVELPSQLPLLMISCQLPMGEFVQLTSTTNSPVGIIFVVDTGKVLAVQIEGCRSDGAKVQGPAFGGSRMNGSLLVYAQLDVSPERVE